MFAVISGWAQNDPKSGRAKDHGPTAGAGPEKKNNKLIVCSRARAGRDKDEDADKDKDGDEDKMTMMMSK